ncbi:MAG: VOC family protein [Gammaproteobacteria bacterium]|nr:VOC family protein [Gammaproteobacteria bacterium]
MADQARFKAAYPFQDDVLALPVADRDVAASWYGEKFAMTEVERKEDPYPTVIMERDGARMGFSENGGDSSNDGGAILVDDAARMKEELESQGVDTGNWRIDERDGKKYQVFFVVAPDGLCFYFHQLLNAD